MDKIDVPAEELAVEQAATQVPKEEEVRAGIIEEYGFDPEADKERIDKLTKKELDNHERLSKAIGQKISWRDKANKPVASVAPLQQDGLSNKDVLYLAKADINEEDLDEVIDYAKLKKIPVAEAHKFMKPILDVRTEERKTAAVTTTRSARVTHVTTGDDLLRKAQQTGEIPESTEGLQELFKARRGIKK